jgi:hypothetical protein
VITILEDTGVSKDKSFKLPKKSVQTVRNTNINKKEFIKRLLKEDANIIWPKEMKMANLLFKIFPKESFWQNLNLGFKLNSLCWLLSDNGRKLLNKEYKKFNLNLPETKIFEIENNNLAFEDKKSYHLDKALNLREFLNLWQKKAR